MTTTAFCNHVLLGREVGFKDKLCNTGARKVQGFTGFSFRLLDLRHPREFWTQPKPCFEWVEGED